MRETDIVRQILQYLSYRHIYCWRNNVGGTVYEGKSRNYFVKHGLKGSFDIIGILPDGRFLAIEVKNEKGRVSEFQQLFIDNINNNHGVAFVARSIDDVIKNLDNSLKKQ